MFSSLRVRNYRLFLAGQAISFTGTWMAAVALGWLVLQITDSGLAVGVTLGLQFGPIALFGMWAGVLADRYDKRHILIRSQSAMAVIAIVLWFVTLTGVVELWMIYSLTFVTGTLTALDHPTRQSFVSEMVGPDGVANAIGLNSAVFNASRIVGPALGAVLIGTIGLEWAFLINALSFGAVVIGLRRMDDAALFRSEPAVRQRGQIREGLRYAWSVPRLRYTLGLEAVVATFGLNFSVVLPLFARFEFGSGASTFGFLTSMMAGGALIGALLNAYRGVPDRRWLVGTAGAFGCLVLLASIAPNATVMAVVLVGVGASSISFIAAANTTLQLRARPDMRGRVMALHGIVFLGSTPFGAPLVGWISETWGARAGLGLGGLLSLTVAIAAAIFIKRDALESRIRHLVRLETREAPAGGLSDDRSGGVERPSSVLPADVPGGSEADRMGLEPVGGRDAQCRPT